MLSSLRFCSLLVLLWMAFSCAAAAEDEIDLKAEEEAMVQLKGWTTNLQKNRDGTVRFVRFSKSAVTNEHVAAVAAFSRLDYLAVETASVDDQGFVQLELLQNLDTLRLSGSSVTDAVLKKVRLLPRLEHLYLDGLTITDEGVAELAACVNLRVLELDGAQITDASASVFASLENLDTLSLANTPITSKTLESLARLPHLRFLMVQDTKVVDLSPLADCESLAVLDASGTGVDLDGVRPVMKSPKLQQLLLRRTAVDATQLQVLRSEFPKLAVHVSPKGDDRASSLERFLSGQQLSGPEVDAAPTSALVPKAVLSPASERFLESGETPDFQRHVVPLLGRLGCNGRSCHGSFQGRGGFRLSMFGYDFAADWEAICGGESPRVDRENPDQSLILQKPTERAPHEGGERFEVGGWEHKLLLAWIRGGARQPSKDPAELVRLAVEPAEIHFSAEKETVSLRCVAEWSDGAREDVTCLTRFQSNDESVAEVNEDGVVKSVGAGDTHIIVFYDKRVVSVPVIRPYAAPRPGKETSPGIDAFIETKLAKLGLEPSPISNDAEFLRRVSLDLVGTLPTTEEITAFLEDTHPDKRDRKIESLMQTPAYVEWWTMRLSDLTGSNAQHLGSTDMNTPAAGQWNDWLRRRVRENVGWDRIAAGMILAQSRRPGQSYATYAAEQSKHLSRSAPTDFAALENPMHYYWFRGNNQTPSDRALAFGFVFLGVRLECAQCHKHPFDQWSQQDFDDFTQFFTRIKAGVAPDAKAAQDHLKLKQGVPKKLDTAALRRQMYLRVSAEGRAIPWNEIWIEPPTAKPQMASLLGGSRFDLNEFEDPREPLFDWLMNEGEFYFSRAMVNRIWAHHFGRGLVEPPDDLNLANPPSHPRLMGWLAEQFRASGYDLKRLHKTILSSRAYQRSSLSNASNQADQRNYSHATVRRLPAEVAIDAILQATAADSKASQWASTIDGRKIAQHPKSFQARGIDYSLLIFGKPLRTTNCDCERQAQPTLLQSIYRRNDQEVLGWLERPDGWLMQEAKKIGESLSIESKAGPPSIAERVEVDAPTKAGWIDQMYLRTLSRPPTSAERNRVLQHLDEAPNHVEALRDVLWALVNSREFITNH